MDFAESPFLYPAKGNEKSIVKIKLTRNDQLDKKLANELGGFGKKQPKGYNWHHLDDYDPVNGTCKMQLLAQNINKACTPHICAIKLVEDFMNIKYR